MGLKIDKTEAEFRDALDRELPELPGEYTRFQVGNALISALDLEFQEPEGRGEGVPKRLEVGTRAHHHEDPGGWYGWALWDEEDARDLNQGIIKGHGPFAFVSGPLSTAEAFRDAYNRGAGGSESVEGRGEGVPEEIYRNDAQGLFAFDQKGDWGTLTPHQEGEVVRRYNYFPDLLGLARELESRLRWWERHSEIPAPQAREATTDTLNRARNLLDRLEGGRE